jgi:hypothetical protein
MATWGSQTWGYENWGTLGDQTIDLSGQSTTTSVDSVTVDARIQIGWGGLAWGEGEWGDLTSPNIDVSGNSLTSTVNSVSIAIGIDAITTSLSLNTDTGEPFVTAPLEVDLTGEELNSTSSTVSLESKYLIGSVEATTTVDSVDTQIDVDIELTGQELTGSTGQLEYEAIYQVTNGSENVVEFTAYNQAQLSTAQAKFGTASLLLDGTNDYVESNSNVDLSSGDFTIDVWIRPSSVSGYKGIWQSGTSTTMQSYLLGNAVYWSVNPSTIITTAVTVNANEWTMLSYERQGTTHRIYKNGTLEDTATTGNKQDNGPFSIGENGFGDFNGYIDEFRLSDTARYGGSSFTEPTGAFVPDSNTTFLLHMDGANGSTNILDDAPGVTIARFDIGEAFGGEVVEVQVTTASAQPWGELTWGDGEWGQSVGTDISIGADTVIVPSVEVDVTGIALNSTAATVSVTADANLSLTGQEVELLQGNENAFSDVTIEVSGQELTTELENVVAGISVLVLPTGVTSTTSTGIMGINAWAVVDPNASTTWSVVDKAAA